MNALSQVPNFSSSLPALRRPPAAGQAPATPAAAQDLVSITGKPLQVGGGEQVMQARQLAQAGQAQAMEAASQAGGLPGLVAKYFTSEEWAQLNPGAYHDQNHPVHVAQTVAEIASGMGRSPERVEFLQEVALLHDVDERFRDGQQNKISPARVPVTLSWMDMNEGAIRERMGWDGDHFKEAKALIGRTDFPFNNDQDRVGRYQQMLQELPAERRQQAMEDGLMLRMADQTGNYTVNQEQSRAYVIGLAQEMRGVGAQVTDEGMLKGSPAFMQSAGLDTNFDYQIAGQLGVASQDFANRDQLLGAMSASRREAFLLVQNNGF